ncbi:MAG: addiction module protein [Planctomycetes bacterium]|nr:addiction module protein [Planctomycetota bacterium]
MSLSTTLSAIRSMSLEDRIHLVQAIWDEIAADQSAVELTDAQKEELDRRLAAYEAAPDCVVPWEEVQARAEERLGK